jgi:Winged helix DNA-binding domain
VRRVGVEERRARLGRRHHLAGEALAGDVVDVARGVVALHATDPASVHLSAWARMPELDVTTVESALYEERALVRMLGMRRTMFVVPDEMVPVLHWACAVQIAERRRRQIVKLAEEAGAADDGEAWLTKAEEATHDALLARGAAVGSELSADVPALREKFSYGEGKKWAAKMNFTTQVLAQMGLDGVIVRGRPRGNWNSSQYRWAPIEDWFPQGIAELPRDDAQVELMRAWLAAFGPATLADLKWWTGLTMGEVKRAVARIAPVEVELDDGGTGLVLADDLEPVVAPDPWVALLPALDPTAMGWTERGWYLGEHRARLFDRSGNIGPTIWCDGRIVGGWGQRKGGAGDGEVVFRLLEDVGAEAAAAVAAAAERLTAWLGDVRVLPRFRTPLERELTA